MIDNPSDSDPLLDHAGESAPENENEDQDTVDDWSVRVNKMQHYANVTAHILSVLSVITVILWIHALGGLSWEQGKAKLVFNWHPLLMVCAFAFMTVASLSFHSRLTTNRTTLKWTHGMAWSVAAFCAMVALIAVFKSHNDAASGFIANLYSLHSWIGCAVIGMYVCQFLVGVFTFAWPLASMTPVKKARILQIHKFVGPFIYNCAAATILLGLQEKEGFIGCAYTVTKADTFPLQHLFDIPSVCRTSHGLGILVLSVALCTNLALYDFKGMSPSSSQHVL